MSSLAPRNLFDTPMRPTKRRRITKTQRRGRPAPMRVPRYLLPEVKQFVRTFLTDFGTNNCESSIGVDMTQGDGGNEFVGHRIRALRLRVNYDLTGITPTSTGFRIVVLMPKRPSAPALTVPTNTTDPIVTQTYTVLFERFIPNDPSSKVGTFDVPLNFNIELDGGGTTVQKNDLRIVGVAAGNGSAMRLDIGYALWYTDA